MATVYLSAFGCDNCVEIMGADPVMHNKRTRSKTQQWTVEYGEDQNHIAYRNVANEEYLSTPTGAYWTRVVTSETKQTWSIIEGDHEGYFWIRNDTFPDFYLCNFEARPASGNKIHMWKKEAYWEKSMHWKFTDPSGSAWKPGQKTAIPEQQPQQALSNSTPSGGLVRLIAFGGNNCVESKGPGSEVKHCIRNNNKTQDWAVEYDKDKKQIAFKNVGNGEYLFAPGAKSWTKVVTSSSKQWWTIEDGEKDGHYWIRSVTYRDSYLCNYRAYQTDNNQVHMWAREMAWINTLQWRLTDPSGSTWTPGQEVAASVAEEQPQQASCGHEQDLQKIQQREEAAAQKEQTASQKEQDLAAKEAGLNKLAEQLAAKEKDLASKKPSAPKPAPDASSKENDLAARETDLQSAQAALQEKEREVAAREAAAKKPVPQAPSPPHSSANERELLIREKKLKTDVARLQGENKKLQAQVTALAVPKPCGHVIHAPPKKIDRRVLGYMYEYDTAV